jgi:dTDP-4-dehydrorhamnose 3,5-epimerase
MKVIKTKIDDLLVIEPKLFGDERGHFFESYQEKKYQENGIPYKFVQDNRSRSSKGVLRGLHYQKTKPQGKLVSVLYGEVLDVVVDLRPESKTFGYYESFILSGDNFRQLFVPPGFAHGFVVLSEYADFYYKCTDYYDPNDEGGLLWNDPELDIHWGLEKPCISEKDAILPLFKEVISELILESQK